MPKLKHDPRSGESYKLSPKSTGTRRQESLEGSPWPLGVTWVEAEQAYNFALYSQHASRVRLLIYEAERLVEPVFVYEFDQFRNKTGAVWHARIPRTQTGTAAYYAYSVDGPTLSGEAPKLRMFNSAKILLDPYAKQVFFPANFERSAALSADTNAGRALLGVLGGGADSFDWSGDSTPRHEHDLVIYEMHVRGFTMNSNSEVDSQGRGTFAGVIEKIPYLQELGITAVELMPVFEFDDTEPNYWGYMPISFFAPHHRYAGSRDGAAAVREFREMVKALHQAEIEVILDVVYNHTGEGNEHGPVFSLKGIDAATYYMSSSDPNRTYADFTGAGNTLNCAHPAARQLIVDSLRYWVREMHVDGFRFDLASVFSCNSDGTINFEEPPIFGDIAADPDLARVRLIAEPWEGNAQYPNYELGQSAWVYGRESKACCEKPACPCPPTRAILQRSFPGAGWKQWNDTFRNTVRRFVKSDSGLVADLMTRIYGSSDVFPDSIESSCRPHQSLNYIASHDGPTLYDLVAYDSDDSWNCGNRDGEEGVGDEVLRVREQQVKNFCCLLLLSNGTPMFRAGDEFLQTQFGHRELLQTYCQRYQELRTDQRVKLILVFRNHGVSAGTSLVHPHSQLVATPIVPLHIRQKYQVAIQHYDDTGHCLYCDLVDDEKAAGKRIVLETPRLVVFHPFASQVPFETWIIPKHHNPCFAQTQFEERLELASTLRRVLRALHDGLGNPDFNLIVHTAPVEGEKKPYFLWHIEIRPRLTTEAGFELGTGIYINTAIPEETAPFFKSILAKVPAGV